MKTKFAILLMFIASVVSGQFINTGNNTQPGVNTTERYVTNSPTNAVGNRKVIEEIKDSTSYRLKIPNIRFDFLDSVKSVKGSYGYYLSANNFGTLRKNPVDSLKVKISQVNKLQDSLSNRYTKAQADAKFLQSFVEADPIFNASVASGITSGNVILWNSVTNRLLISDTTNKWRPVTWVPSWSQITGKPVFATVATTGAYSDLTGTPNLSLYYLASNPAGYITISSLTWSNITGKPTFSAVATTGAYADLSGKPDLSVYYLASNPSGYITLSSLTWSNVTGKPTFATVATSGSYNDLINKLTAGTGISVAGNVITNTAPDQVVSLTGSNGLVTGGTYPNLTITKKRQETYSGTTNASGNYTVTFGTSYSVAPNIQANIIGGTNTNLIKISSISTTGFTVNVVTRVDVIGLLPTYNNVNGAAVDVLITEK